MSTQEFNKLFARVVFAYYQYVKAGRPYGRTAEGMLAWLEQEGEGLFR